MRFVCYTMAFVFPSFQTMEVLVNMLNTQKCYFAKEAFIQDLSKDWPRLQGHSTSFRASWQGPHSIAALNAFWKKTCKCCHFKILYFGGE